MFDDILDIIEKMAYSHEEIAYVILGISAFVENIFPPIPGDTVTVFAAFLVGKKALSFTWVFVSTTIGSTVGFMSLFYLSYFYGSSFFKKKQWKFFNISHIEKVNSWFDKYGYFVIAINRFISGLRSVISIAAGLVKFNPKLVFILAFISGAIWNFLLLYLGFVMGDNWTVIVSYVKDYSRWVFFAVILFISFFVFIRFLRRNNDIKNSTE